MDWRRVAVGVLLVGCVTDIATTVIGIEYTPASEFNPIIAPLIDLFGYAGLLPPTVFLILFTLGAARVIEQRNEEPYGRQGATWAIGLIGGMKVAVSLWNSFLVVQFLL